MTISLSLETQKLLEDRLKTGEYRSIDDVLYAALEALSEQEKYGLDEQTLHAIDQAEDQIDAGEIHDWKTVREQVRSKFMGK